MPSDLRGHSRARAKARSSSRCRRRICPRFLSRERSNFPTRLAALADAAPGRCLPRRRPLSSRRRAAPACALWPNSARAPDAPLVAVNDVHYHAPERRPLADVAHLHPREMHHRRSRLPARRQCRAPLKPPAEMARLFAKFSRRHRPHRGNRRGLPLLARRTQIRISRRAGAARQNRAAASRRSHLGGRRAGVIPRRVIPDGIPSEVVKSGCRTNWR